MLGSNSVGRVTQTESEASYAGDGLTSTNLRALVLNVFENAVNNGDIGDESVLESVKAGIEQLTVELEEWDELDSSLNVDDGGLGDQDDDLKEEDTELKDAEVVYDSPDAESVYESKESSVDPVVDAGDVSPEAVLEHLRTWFDEDAVPSDDVKVLVQMLRERLIQLYEHYLEDGVMVQYQRRDDDFMTEVKWGEFHRQCLTLTMGSSWTDCLSIYQLLYQIIQSENPEFLNSYIDAEYSLNSQFMLLSFGIFDPDKILFRDFAAALRRFYRVVLAENLPEEALFDRVLLALVRSKMPKKKPYGMKNAESGLESGTLDLNVWSNVVNVFGPFSALFENGSGVCSRR